MASKDELQAELQIALIDRDQQAQQEIKLNTALAVAEKQIAGLQQEINNLTKPVPKVQTRSWGELDAPEMGVVEEIVLKHYDEHYGPPEQPVLRVMLGGGDVIFLEIAEVDAEYVQTR